MTKRIVSGIFILTALGALGVILAGALSSGEQLIVRFLTAVIVAALGLYVISDLRLQADDDAARSGTRGSGRLAAVDAPPNSTAAFMATVTRRGMNRDEVPSGTSGRSGRADEAKDDRNELHEAGVGATPSSTTERASAVVEGAGSLNGVARHSAIPGPAGRDGEPTPNGDTATVTDLFGADRGAGHIAEWPRFGDDEAGDFTTFGRSGAGERPGTFEDDAETGDGHDDSVEEYEIVDEFDAIETEDATGTGASIEAEDTAEAEDVIGAEDATGAEDTAAEADPLDPMVDPVDATAGETRSGFEYSGELDVADLVWPAPPSPPATPDEADTDVAGEDEDEISSEVETDTDTDTDEVIEVEADLGTGADPAQDGEVATAALDTDDREDLAASAEHTPDHTVIPDHTVTPERTVAEHSVIADETAAEGGTVDTDRPSEDGHEDRATRLNGSHRDLPTALPVAGRYAPADYADAPLAPIIDLRSPSTIETSVETAIQAGELEVIATLIEQGMLSTDGPISDRDVRTMVYVAFTSNELRKLLRAGGSPEQPNHELDLGPVELFDERSHAPAPKALYPGRIETEARSQLG